MKVYRDERGNVYYGDDDHAAGFGSKRIDWEQLQGVALEPTAWEYLPREHCGTLVLTVRLKGGLVEGYIYE